MKKNAQTAEKQKPKLEEKPLEQTAAVPSEAVAVATPEAAPLTVIEQMFSQVSPTKLEMAKEMGLPLQELVNYMALQEKKTDAIITVLKDDHEKLGPLFKALEQQKQPQTAMAPADGQQPQGNTASFMAMVKEFLGGSSGGADPRMTMLYDKLIEGSLKRLDRGSRYEDAMEQAIIARLAGKVSTEVVP